MHSLNRYYVHNWNWSWYSRFEFIVNTTWISNFMYLLTSILVRLHTCLNLSNSSDISLEILFDFPLISGKVPWVFKERIGSIRFTWLWENLINLCFVSSSIEENQKKQRKKNTWKGGSEFFRYCSIPIVVPIISNNCFAMQAISCPIFWPFWSHF